MSKFDMSGSGFAATRKSGADFSKKVFAVLCILSLVLFTISCREGDSGAIATTKGALTVVTKPFKVVGETITSPFRGINNIFSNLTASSKTLSELEAENKALLAKNAELQEAQQAALRLEGLLRIKGTYDLTTAGARIISDASDSWSDTVTIDQGSSAGLAVGMPVIDSTGVIGQITECGVSTSTVRLITDENSKVSAMVSGSRVQGMLRGAANGTLKLTLVKIDADIHVGDVVITSGLGGVFPKGLPLGKIISVEKPEGAIYCTVLVDPLSSVVGSEEVLVVTGLKESQQATKEEAAAADATGAFPEDKTSQDTKKKEEQESQNESGSQDAKG